MTAHLLSVTLQTNLNELLTSLSFLVVAIIILSLFFFWWRNVSDNDLDLVKEADANQVTGPAITGAEPPEHVQAEAEAIAEQKSSPPPRPFTMSK
ncbi:MAG: hypothetical protein M5U34_38335 [Chloroflexi bacterium]|nr:hypothetical protein [Chloroflexota bacterium]